MAPSTRRRAPTPGSTPETCSSPWARRRSCARSKSCSRRLGPLPGSPLSRLEAALAEATGTAVELARPPETEQGDYATTAALKAAPVRRRAPRELGAEIAAAAERLP